MSETTVAARLVRTLEATGVEVVFGIPGVHTLPLYAALGDSTLRHVLPAHEQGAAFMADGYARVTGRYAACALVSGPGLLNAATAIGEAYADSVPMLVLTTVNRREHLGLGRGELHELRDQRLALAGCVETALTVGDAAALDGVMAEAATALTTGRRRPVVVEVPLDVLPSAGPDGDVRVPVVPPPVPSAATLAAARELLAKARRPLILAGGGAVEAAAEVRALQARLGAVVAATIAGKGVVPDRAHGALGQSLRGADARTLAAEADLVLVVGSELASRDCGRLDWMDGKPLVRIDLCPRTLTRGRVPDLALLGDAKAALGLLLEGLPERGDGAWAARAEAVNAAARAARLRGREHQGRFLEALRAALPDAAIVATDMTQIAYTGNVVFEARQPATWLHPAGFGTLGYALPAAIGARIGRPERPVVALAGDYGFGFTANELATARDLALPLPVIVWNNARPLDVIREMEMAGIAKRVGTDPGPVDFAALASAYGCRHVAVTPEAGLVGALEAAFAAAAPTVIEVDAAADREGLG